MEEETPDILFLKASITSLDKRITKESEIDKYYSKIYKPEPVLYQIERFLGNYIYYLSLGIWDARKRA